MAYRFRLDKQTLESRRKELDMQYTSKGLTFSAAYLKLQNDPIFASREEITGSASFDVTKNWAVSATARRDLQLKYLTNAGVSLLFKNECVNIAGVVNRIYTQDREVKPDTKYLIQFSLKNLN